MKVGAKYTATINGTEFVCDNKIHASYFNYPPQSQYYCLIGSGESDIPMESGSLESFIGSMGSVSHGNLVRKVEKLSGLVRYSFSYTWPISTIRHSGVIGEVGLSYNSSGIDSRLISRARFLDYSGFPRPIKVTIDDVIGLKANIDLYKDISPVRVELSLLDGVKASGSSYDVNLKSWFERALARPIPERLSISLFNSTNLAIQENGFNDLSGDILVSRSGAASPSEAGSDTNRKFTFSSYFSPTVDYTFSYIGLYEGGSSVANGYYMVIALDSPVSIGASDEFTVTINLDLSEGIANGNT